MAQLKFKQPATAVECWIDETTTPELTAIKASKPTMFDSLIISACSWTNNFCNRYFNLQQADDIFNNWTLNTATYKQVALRNAPIKSIDKITLETAGGETEISTDSIQVDEQKGIIKILPNILYNSVSAVYPYYKTTDFNLKVRYTSGYTIADIPHEIKLATALYANFLNAVSEDAGTTKSFKTLNYSETKAGTGESPVLSMAKGILSKYMILSIS